MTSPLPFVTTAEQLHTARSKLLDAFVRVEESVARLLVASKTSFNGEMLGQRIELLRAAKAGPQFSKKKRVYVLKLLDEIVPLLPIRNDIAHGRLQVAMIEQESHACFINVRQTLEPSQNARLFRLEQLDRLTRKIQAIAEELNKPQAITPPSSPPPPSPAAKVGP